MATGDQLRQVAVGRRFDALFRAMSTDFLLREQFVTDPAQVVSEFVYGSGLSAERAAVVNNLVYSVAANKQLLSWLRKYALQRERAPQESGDLLQEFTRAVVDNDGYLVVNALMRNAAEDGGLSFGDHFTEVAESIIALFGSGPDAPGGVAASSRARAVGGPVLTGVTTPDNTFTSLTEGFTNPFTHLTDITDITWITDTTGTGIFTQGGTVTDTTITNITDITDFTNNTQITAITDITETNTGTFVTEITLATDTTEITGVTDVTGITDITGITEITDITEITSPITEDVTAITGVDITGKVPVEDAARPAAGAEAAPAAPAGGTTPAGGAADTGLGFSRDNYALVSLVALATYADQLAQSGLLTSRGQ